MEQQDTAAKSWQVKHTDNINYIINAASLHDPHLHQSISNLPVAKIENRDWLDCVATGLDNWVADTGGVYVTSDEEIYSEGSVNAAEEEMDDPLDESQDASDGYDADEDAEGSSYWSEEEDNPLPQETDNDYDGDAEG
ncbi:hypothetical protein PTTG_01123 [Puccinia triticina 1-1 BBBD Race 1]|uniref:Uncharacterized protein n=2 Tax=Puccinia triticina TaxID=208348 RepID=A0A180GZB9_PUCT1|nr:hypothetical protein PTTG_01123 [Puccinia triticina 1-1 BBBD Race 1]